MNAKTFLILFFVVIIFAGCYPKMAGKKRPGQTTGNQTPSGPKGAKGGDRGFMVGSYNVSQFKGKIFSNVQYGSNINSKNQQQALAMDIYQPPNFVQGKKYPFVLLIHGGGFLNGTKAAMASMAAQLANNGYVSASIDYRLGWLSTPKGNANCGDSIAFKMAVLKAVQDAKASMRFITKNADSYGIDVDRMFIGGASAGAVTAWYSIYMTDKNINRLLPDYNAASMGSINTSTNNIQVSYSVKGLISMWGGFGDPAYITKDNAIPTIFFHGKKDPAAPFNYGYVNHCSDFIKSYGTEPLYNRLKSLNVLALAFVDPNGGHGVFTPAYRLQNTLCFLDDVLSNRNMTFYTEEMKNVCSTSYVNN